MVVSSWRRLCIVSLRRQGLCPGLTAAKRAAACQPIEDSPHSLGLQKGSFGFGWCRARVVSQEPQTFTQYCPWIRIETGSVVLEVDEMRHSLARRVIRKGFSAEHRIYGNAGSCPAPPFSSSSLNCEIILDFGARGSGTLYRIRNASLSRDKRAATPISRAIVTHSRCPALHLHSRRGLSSRCLHHQAGPNTCSTRTDRLQPRSKR